MEERNSRTAWLLWMGNMIELKCHMEVGLLFCNYKHFSVLLSALVDAWAGQLSRYSD
jgi:hypothetical protein